MPYLLEAGNLFAAGAGVTSLDEAMLEFGMPMGPMRLLDEVGIDVALHVAQTLAAAYPNRMHVPPVLGQMVQAGLLGRKSGRGFYLHPKGKEPRPNLTLSVQALSASAPAEYASRLSAPTLGGLQERMVLLMVNEAARCLEEEIVADPADVDFAMLMGTGFAPFRGGPLRHADTLGPATVLDAMERLVQGGAAHFAPCAFLRSLAAAGNQFYPKAV
jgi:3-hydroxyacyl-CoA dehydrogenase / enoyl-CoA hydratase / 3-hydroxybutyryl-CoA epimerase